MATGIPLPKIDNAKTPSDLWPISLLQIFGKIIERISHDQLKEFIERN